MTIFAFTDIETSGLSPVNNYILEVAWVFTDEKFNRLPIPPRSFIVEHGDAWETVAQQIKDSPFLMNMHSTSGLLQELANPDTVTYSMDEILETFRTDIMFQREPGEQVRFAGYSVSFDREFLRENGWGYILNEDSDSTFHMHHQIMDLSSVKQMYQAAGRKVPYTHNANPHRALDDALDSLEKAQLMRDELGAF